MISDYHKPTHTHNMDWPTDYAACFTQVFSSASKTLVAQDLAKGRDTHKKFLKSHFLVIVTLAL